VTNREKLKYAVHLIDCSLQNVLTILVEIVVCLNGACASPYIYVFLGLVGDKQV